MKEFTPYFPPDPEELQELIVSVTSKGSNLEGQFPEPTRDSIREMLRPMNSHYSNKIEGYDTKLSDVEEAVEGDFSEDPDRQELQALATAHIKVQKEMEEKIESDSPSITSLKFLRWIHKRLYEEIPERYHYVEKETADGTEEVKVEPGKLREFPAVIGQHRSDGGESRIRHLMKEYDENYNPDELSVDKRILGLAGSHHRLVWIHPFQDGNGRVTRLMSEAYLLKTPLGSDGIWSLSRGLSIHEKPYRLALNRADRGADEYDRSNRLSPEGLTSFSRIFLAIAEDQIEFMDSVLDFENIEERIDEFVDVVNTGAVNEIDPIHKKSKQLFKQIVRQGEIKRGNVPGILNLSARQSRRIVNEIEDQGLIKSPSERGPIRMNFPYPVKRHLFPAIYDETEQRMLFEYDGLLDSNQLGSELMKEKGEQNSDTGMEMN